MEQTQHLSGYRIVLPVGSLGHESGLVEANSCCGRNTLKTLCERSCLLHFPSLLLLDTQCSPAVTRVVGSWLFLTAERPLPSPTCATNEVHEPRNTFTLVESDEYLSDPANCLLCLGSKYKLSAVSRSSSDVAGAMDLKL